MLQYKIFIKPYKPIILNKNIFLKMLTNQKVNIFLSFFSENSHRFAKELFDEI